MDRSDPEVMRHYSKSAYRSIDNAREPHGQEVLVLCHSDYVESESPVNNIDQIIQTTENSQVVFLMQENSILLIIFGSKQVLNFHDQNIGKIFLKSIHFSDISE